MKQAPAAEGAFARHALGIAVTLMVLIAAHVGIEPQRTYADWSGNVLLLDPTTVSTYEGEHLRIEPALIMIGDSQQRMVAASVPHDGTFDAKHGTLVNHLARRLDERYPDKGRRYLRLAGSDFGPLDELASIGLWLTRARFARRVTVVAGIDLVAAANHESIRPPLELVLKQFPAELAELKGTIAGLPEGEDAVRRLSDLTATAPPFTLDGVEDQLTSWSRRHKLYYGDPYGTLLYPLARYEKAENRVLTALRHPPRRRPSVPSETPKTEKQHFITTLVRHLVERGFPVLCYPVPLNPAVHEDSPMLERMVEDLRRTSTEAGCSFVDAWHPLRASPENWGYLRAQRDEVHLTAIGHEALARLLFEEGAKLGAWNALEAAASGAAPP